MIKIKNGSVILKDGREIIITYNNNHDCSNVSQRLYMSYYSRNYGCNQQWYMIVYTLEDTNDPDLENRPGVTACDGSPFNYDGTITIGECRGCYE